MTLDKVLRSAHGKERCSAAQLHQEWGGGNGGGGGTLYCFPPKFLDPLRLQYDVT